MDYHEFLSHVRREANLASSDDALQAVRATFTTLGERITGGEAGNLAAQLPVEIGVYLLKRVQAGESFGLDEFFSRVSRREGVDLPTATSHAKIVLKVLADAVQPDLIEKVKAQLPDEFDRLFEYRRVG